MSRPSEWGKLRQSLATGHFTEVFLSEGTNTLRSIANPLSARLALQYRSAPAERKQVRGMTCCGVQAKLRASKAQEDWRGGPLRGFDEMAVKIMP
jgi:hypothetical protein